MADDTHAESDGGSWARRIAVKFVIAVLVLVLVAVVANVVRDDPDPKTFSSTSYDIN